MHVRAVGIAAIVAAAFVSVCLAQVQQKPTRTPAEQPASTAAFTKDLPAVFMSVLPELKAKSRIPIILPSKLPAPVNKAEHAVVAKAAANEYAISLYYELGVGDAGFAGFFAADANPKHKPQELSNVSEVKLVRGIRGFFRPVSCGGSCAPANLWWEEGGILYQIQLELPSAVSGRDQEKTVTAVADSAILAGPR